MQQSTQLFTRRPSSVDRAVPIGAELLIALVLGLSCWWGIVHLVLWLAF